jgi:DNA-binding NarL/FixJ family response regulator
MKNGQETVRALLVDGQSMLMKGIADSLREEKRIELLDVAEDGVSFSELIPAHQPDVILCDVDYGGKCDFSILREVDQGSGNRPKIIAFSDCADMAYVAAFFYNGGWGYELKSCHEDEIDIAIRRVMQGHHFVCSALGGDFMYDVVMASPPIYPGLLKILTDRESEVLAMVREGKNAKDVARELERAERTARTHIDSILKKLGIHSQDELRRRLIYTVLE